MDTVKSWTVRLHVSVGPPKMTLFVLEPCKSVDVTNFFAPYFVR